MLDHYYLMHQSTNVPVGGGAGKVGIAHFRAGLIHVSDISTGPAYGISALNAQIPVDPLRE